MVREFEPSAQAIRTWIKQADQDRGRGATPRPVAAAALSAAERDELARLRREVRQLWVERDILSRAAAGPHRARAMGALLGVSKAGYYAWLRRLPSARDAADAALPERAHAVHAASRQTYGAPRVHAALRAGGERHGRTRIARLMREAGLVGASYRCGGPVTTRQDDRARPAPDLVDRDFSAAGPNRLWVSDITFIPSAAGFLYLADVLDA